MFSLRPAHLSLGPSPSNPDYGSSSSSSRRSLSSLLQVHNNLRHSKCIISQSILERIDREGSKSPSSHQSHRNQKEMSKANLHLKSPRKVLKALVEQVGGYQAGILPFLERFDRVEPQKYKLGCCALFRAVQPHSTIQNKSEEHSSSSRHFN